MALSLLGSLLLGLLITGIGSPGLISIMRHFQELRKGTQKNIPKMMVTVSVLEILVISLSFNLVFNVYLQEQQSEINKIIITFCVEIVAGIVCGHIFGSVLRIVRLKGSFFKAVVLMVLAISISVISEIFEYRNFKYISIISYSYIVRQRGWKLERNSIYHPAVNNSNKEVIEYMKKLAYFTKVFMFGSTGISIEMNPLIKHFEFGFLLIILAISTKFVLIIMIPILCRPFKCYKHLNIGERVFMAASFITKGTLQALFGGMLQEKALEIKNQQLEKQGIMFQTVAVLSVMISQPIGSIMAVNLGNKYLKRSAAI